jgi:hypothetical protein
MSDVAAKQDNFNHAPLHEATALPSETFPILSQDMKGAEQAAAGILSRTSKLRFHI